MFHLFILLKKVSFDIAFLLTIDNNFHITKYTFIDSEHKFQLTDIEPGDIKKTIIMYIVSADNKKYLICAQLYH
jgi:hypothetical protein